MESAGRSSWCSMLVEARDTISSSSSPTSSRRRRRIAARDYPFGELITRGWLRASHRPLDLQHCTEMVPYHSHCDPQPLTPNEIYKFRDQLEPMAYLIKQRHVSGLEIVNGDSPGQRALWPHYYRPDKVGSDQHPHAAAHPSK